MIRSTVMDKNCIDIIFEGLRDRKKIFPQHFMFVGLLFYIPEQDDRQIGISRFSALSGSTTLVVIVVVIVVVVVVVIVAPLRS